MTYGYQVLGFGSIGHPSPKVNISTMTTTSDLGIWCVGGDWVYDSDETNSQSGTATNWLMMNAPYNTSYYASTPISYNTTTHSVSELSSDWNTDAQAGTSHSGSANQLSLDRSVWGMRSTAPSNAYDCQYYTRDLADNLQSHTNSNTEVTVRQRYGSGYRLNDTQGFYHAQTNQSVLVGIVTYTGGASGNSTLSATTAEGDNQYRFGAFGSPGGSGSASNYGNLGTSNQLFWMNDNDTRTFDQNTTNVDINHASWNGSAGASLSLTANNGAITLPSHTGSTIAPECLTTTWGNIFIHGDSANPGNAVVFPCTWSGGSATVGSSVAWAGGTDIPAHECYLRSLSGVGDYLNNKYSCGQDRAGVPDLYRTVRIYASGSDLLVDTIVMDFSASNGQHTVRKKQEAVTTFSSSTSTDIWPIFMANNTDLAIWHKDTAKFHYIENAFY